MSALGFTWLGMTMLFATWALVVYVQYAAYYYRVHNINRTAWDAFMRSGYEWGIMFERQTDPEVERLRRRALRLYAIIYAVGFATMFVFVKQS